MKNLKVLLGLVLAMGLFLNLAQAESYYPILCKGGGDAEVEYDLQFWPGLSTGSVYVNFEIRFRRSSTSSGARGENLADGSCSWPDRGMNADEPERMIYRGDGTGRLTNFQATVSAVNKPASKGNLKFSSQVDRMTQSGEVTRFSVRRVTLRPGEDCFVIDPKSTVQPVH
jgi:hypothetical protein